MVSGVYDHGDLFLLEFDVMRRTLHSMKKGKKSEYNEKIMGN